MAAPKVTIVLSSSAAHSLHAALLTVPKQTKTVLALTAKVQEAIALVPAE
jgi:hypothetical protein